MRRTDSLFIGLITSALFVSGCGKGMKAANMDSNGSLGGCDGITFQAFTSGAYAFFREANSCVRCHDGSGPPAFASADTMTAYNQFKLAGITKIQSRGVDTHGAPTTGPQNQTRLASIASSWQTAENAYNACIAGPGGPSTPTSKRLDSTAQTLTAIPVITTINAATPAPKIFTWDLSKDITGVTIPGATFSVGVRIYQAASGQKSYLISNPTIKTGTTAVHVKDILFNFNGALLAPENIFSPIDRKIAINTTQNMSAAQLVYATVPAETDTLGVSFGTLETTTFVIVTYAQLTNAAATDGSNIFASACLSCHSAAAAGAQGGGFDMSTRNNIVNSGRAVPFLPAQSELLMRMRSTTAPMPPSGNLTPTQIQFVDDWVTAGAPN